MTASRWRRRPARIHAPARVWAAAVVIAVSLGARAGEVPAGFCPLHSPPALSWLRLAKGDDCAEDEDGNGLDDAVEAELAACFVPEIVFDSRENARRPDEPHVLYSAYPLGNNVVRLHFAFLFEKDGGYVLGTAFPCLQDDHDGDVESITVDVAWTEQDRHWYGALLSMSTRHPRDDALVVSGSRKGADVPEISGTHPIVYATAGKHHWLHHSESLAYSCRCGPFGRCGSVQDGADGAGATVIPRDIRHAPGFYLGTLGGLEARAKQAVRRILSQAPIADDASRFWNACSFGATGLLLPATHSLASNDLTELGYPGERVYGSCFRGGLGGVCNETISVAEALSWDKPFVNVFRARKLVSTLLGGPAPPLALEVPLLVPLGSTAERPPDDLSSQ